MDREWNGIPLPRGVEVASDNGRDPVVRVRFTYKGVPCREPIGPANKSNIKLAADKIATVRLALKTATASAQFKYGDHFPDSERCKMFGEFAMDGVLFGTLVADYRKKFMPALVAVTRLGYDRIFDHKILPKWKAVSLSKITSEAIEEWIVELAVSGIILKTVRNILTPMRNAFELCGAKYGVKANPFDNVRLKRIWPQKQKDSDYEPDPWSDEERAAIFAQCEKSGNEQWANQFQAWCWSGLRPQEICALKWSAIDFINDQIEVRRVLSITTIEERTKTKAGRRRFPMHPNAKAAFLRQKKITHSAFADTFVFMNPVTGKPWRHVTAMSNYQWPTILKRAGVRHRGPGQCRHTYANLMLSNDENPVDVAAWMGHANVGVLYSKYVRAIREAQARRGKTQFRGDYLKVAI